MNHFGLKKTKAHGLYPKGELNDNEDLQTAARREKEEETSIKVSGDFISLIRFTTANARKKIIEADILLIDQLEEMLKKEK